MEKIVKCVVIGNSTVGKTCLCNNYTKGEYREEWPSILNSLCKEVTVDGAAVLIQLYDTPSKDDYERLRPLIYSGMDIFMICFSIDSPTAFESVRSKWILEVKQHSPSAHVILIGTKSDLRNDQLVKTMLVRDKMELVTHAQGIELAMAIGAVKYLECSAMTGEGLEHVIEETIRIVLNSPAKRQLRKRGYILL